ncbi:MULTISPECIES: carboxymuconolactone decarboxylase family protein [Paenarthrobacter]|uniref:carboxymuconolactone decarboxylase family protein n=1 Tax=Paenarthrobacter TaxID=1742992 RepID=UPI00074D3155|nr:carboxymuconolactone decarboxylase family protein [Paenarthrobacter ureafaciens]AMB40326.1 carboxymuconolactone decarboxylase [Arthrobacter sp. ATCC 21022]KUR63531.1 carboxymuconolactone decarboxylase [Arthrobacter sp. ATCC 21022]RWW91487.1 carboxymuconolactone decarboxylase family protein [Paenarthrobacter ureafaciens]
MSRVPSLSRDHAASIDQQPLWDRLEAERKVPTANIFRTLANAPVLLDAFLSYANALRDGSELSPKLRELAILSVGHATGSEYEIAHHQSHGRKAGITDEQLAAVADAANSGLFTEAELAVIALARESTNDVHVSSETWDAAAAHLDDQQMVELTLTIAWYNSGVRIMGLLHIDLEDSYRK